MSPDPMTEEAPYRVSSKAPPGLRLVGNDASGITGVEWNEDDQWVSDTLENAMEKGWIDTAPVIRNRRKKEAATPASAKDPGPAIYPAMVAILKSMPAIGKNAFNSGQRFNYRSIDEVLDHLNPRLAEHGVFFAPEVQERVAEQRQSKGGGTLWTVHLRVRFTFYALDGSKVAAETWGEGTDSGDKATSKAHTMAMKSALMEILAISDNEVGDPDGGGEAADPAKVPEPPEDSMSAEHRDEIREDIKKLGPGQTKLFKKLWVAANIPPLDHAWLRESHGDGIWTLLANCSAVPEDECAKRLEEEPKEATS